MPTSIRRRRSRHDRLRFPDGRWYKGREEFVRYFHEQWDTWDDLRMDPLDVADVGGRSGVFPPPWRALERSVAGRARWPR